ncbi:hypothetical protein PAECIP111890_03171 [Paenibacillus sp. JJ-223]|nr:hypothetical protein PAECIP111890_03171 [Paenibacillus sp. JJ-223]
MNCLPQEAYTAACIMRNLARKPFALESSCVSSYVFKPIHHKTPSAGSGRTVKAFLAFRPCWGRPAHTSRESGCFMSLGMTTAGPPR